MINRLYEYLGLVTVKDVITWIIYAFIGLCLFLEKIKNSPYHPFTMFFKWIGKLMNEQLEEKIDNVAESAKKNNEDIKALDRKVDEREIKRLRSDMICFADSCSAGNKYSKEHYENILTEYTDYLNLCDTHSVPNHVLTSKMNFVQNQYQEKLFKNSFD